MEYIVTLWAIESKIGPSEAWKEIKSPQTVANFWNEFHHIVRSKYFLLSETDVIDWLLINKNENICEIIADSFESVYFPQNASELLSYCDIPVDDKYRTDQTNYNLQFYGHSYKKDLDNIESPFFIESRRATDIETYLYPTNNFKYHISNLTFILQKLSESATSDEMCRLFEKFTNHENLHSLLKFFASRSINQKCTTPIIQSFGPTIAQVYFAHPSAWCDSDSSEGHQDWRNFLPQWRCTALVYSATQSKTHQCERFAMIHSEFCLQHGYSSRKLKRVFTTGNDVEATRDQYNRGPNEKQQPVRYQATNRPITSMTSVLPITKRLRSRKPGYYLPIVRYSGLYYSHQDNEEEEEEEEEEDKKEEYCGKFFFYEPDSSHYVYIGQGSGFFATKVHAYIELAKMCQKNQKQVEELESDVFDKWKNYNIKDSDSFSFIALDKLKFMYNVPNGETIMKILLYCFLEEFVELKKCLSQSSDPNLYLDTFLQYRYCFLFNSQADINNPWHNIGFPLFYPTVGSNLFSQYDGTLGVGALDMFDQPLCRMAKSLNIDTLILQHEIGSHDCVSEILHTGTFRNDVEHITQVESELPISKQFAKIYFPVECGLVVIEPSQSTKLKPASLFDFGMTGHVNHLELFDCGEPFLDEEIVTSFHVPFRYDLPK